MSVIFITNLRTQYSLPVIRAIHEDPALEIAHVLFVDRLQAKASPIQLWRKHGTRKLVLKSFQTCERKWRIRQARRGQKSGIRFTHEYAIAEQIPHSIHGSVNSPKVKQLISSLRQSAEEPITGLVCSCSQILTRNFLESFPRPPINIHPSPLPKYRGPRPAFWMLFHGETKAAVTFHEISPSVDDGAILAQFPLDAQRFRTEDSLMQALFERAGDQVVGVLEGHENGSLVSIPQESKGATYQSFPSPEQRREFAAKGLA